MWQNNHKYKMYYYVEFLLLTFFISNAYPSTDIDQEAVKRLHCALGLVKDDSCPVDGGWTSWGSWGPCKGDCGSPGKKIRSRSCNNPPPSEDGAPCIGVETQILTCQINGCTMDDYEKIAKGDPVRNEEIKMVKAIHEQVPALDKLCFSANCDFPIVNKVLKSDAMTYWNAMNCVKHGVGCPITGGWSRWKAWSSCSAPCGKGSRYRERFCDNPRPSDSELTCDGESFEAEDCTGVHCDKLLSGKWSEWNEWTKCSVECGNGIQKRTRECAEVRKRRVYKRAMHETACEGANREIQKCEVTDCSVDGMWSAWTSWSICSSNCGVGAQSRNRMCSNPAPSGKGANCKGTATEVRQCFARPCSVKTHEVAIFSGDSQLLYSTNGKRSRLLHTYLRFYPLAPYGVLFHRWQSNCEGVTCDFVRLSLQSGKVTLLAQISGCTLVLMREDRLEIGQWHETMVTLTGNTGTVRVDNNAHSVSSFSCIPMAPNLDHQMKMGERFRGQIQQVSINFTPIRLRLEKGSSEHQSGSAPYTSNYMEYVMGDDDEGLVRLEETQLIRAQCPKDPQSWEIIMALKPDQIDGLILLIPGETLNNYLLLILDKGRVVLDVHQGDEHTNAESREDSVAVGDWLEIVLACNEDEIYLQVNGDEKKYVTSISETSRIACTDNIFIGAPPSDVKTKICPACERMNQVTFVLGLVSVDGHEEDLTSLPTQEVTDGHRFSSHLASFSDHYEEVPTLLGRELKLSCFYDRTIHGQKIHVLPTVDGNVIWLFLDKPLRSKEKGNGLYSIKDNGRVSTITASSYANRDEIEGFYSCWLPRPTSGSPGNPGKILFTFGVAIIDENKEFGGIPWREWSFVSIISAFLLIFMVAWLLYEGILDLQAGHGFYRLPAMSRDRDLASMLGFILSNDGLILLGSQQAVDEVVAKLTEERRILDTSGCSTRDVLQKDWKLPEVKETIRCREGERGKDDETNLIDTPCQSLVGVKTLLEKKSLSRTSGSSDKMEP